MLNTIVHIVKSISDDQTGIGKKNLNNETVQFQKQLTPLEQRYVKVLKRRITQHDQK